MSKLQVGVIGAGAWGIHHVRVIANNRRCRLVAVADPDPAVAERVSRFADVPTLRHADEVLADRRIDAVVIASPSRTHAGLVRATLAAGKHVLVEKPLAMDVASAFELARQARVAGRVAMVGHLMIYHPAVVRLLDLLQSGALGTLHYLHSTRANLGRIRADESVLWSLGPHDLSMIDFLLPGAPQTVTARGQCVVHADVEDVVFLTLRYVTGEMAHVHLSRLSSHKERRLTLVCSDKLVEFDDVSTDKVRVFDRGGNRPTRFDEYAEYLALRDGDVHIPQITMREPLQLQLHHFVDCIRMGVEARTGLDSAVQVVRVLEAAERSLARDGTPVDLATESTS